MKRPIERISRLILLVVLLLPVLKLAALIPSIHISFLLTLILVTIEGLLVYKLIKKKKN